MPGMSEPKVCSLRPRRIDWQNVSSLLTLGTGNLLLPISVELLQDNDASSSAEWGHKFLSLSLQDAYFHMAVMAPY